MDDIVERLREHIAVVIDNKGHVFEDEHLCDIAADRIEALEENLSRQIDFKRDYRAAFEETHDKMEALETRVAAADALVAVLELPKQSHPKRATYEYLWYPIDDAIAAYQATKEQDT